ncbi:aminotransferase class I/II-fold pyridoxal phosphate-dependent enzyme [Moritella viscosa]
MTLVHGGQLQQVAQQYARSINDWLDLSTGISPSSYPIPAIPTYIWQQLPQPSQSLILAARHYYSTNNIVATSGSQAVIKQLPSIFKQHVAEHSTGKITVWLPQVGYKEHERAWREQGFTIQQYVDLPTTEQLTANCIVVVINPNNPTGELLSRNTLLALLDNIQTLKGWLILDEAFMDVVKPSQSIIVHTNNPHLLVLRSAIAGSALFKTVQLDNAQDIYTLLCQQGVYVRLCDEKNALRFGIPDESGLIRLTKVLQQLF